MNEWVQHQDSKGQEMQLLEGAGKRSLRRCMADGVVFAQRGWVRAAGIRY